MTTVPTPYKPMSLAPKDGTVILGLLVAYDYPVPVTWHLTGKWVLAQSNDLAPIPDCLVAWMPVPETPTVEQLAEKLVPKPHDGVTWDHTGKAFVKSECYLSECDLNPCKGKCKIPAPEYDLPMQDGKVVQYSERMRKARVQILRDALRHLRPEQGTFASAFDEELERVWSASNYHCGWKPTCPECRGSGLRDSGGAHPWGEPIFLECDCDKQGGTDG